MVVVVVMFNSFQSHLLSFPTRTNSARFTQCKTHARQNPNSVDVDFKSQFSSGTLLAYALATGHFPCIATLKIEHST